MFNTFLVINFELPSQRAASELSAHQKKILPIDDHVAVAIAGLTSDARLLRLVLRSGLSPVFS